MEGKEEERGKEKGCWLAFHQALGFGLNRWAGVLLRRYGTLAAAWQDPELTEGAWLPQEVRLKLLAARRKLRPEEILDRCADRGIGILTLLDKEYPDSLLQISDNPVILYYYGKTELLKLPMVAVVGSRHCSGYGQLQAGEFSRRLAQAGLCIVSGLAKGIDGCAHRGALQCGGATVAVLGSGVDVIYPRENRGLYEQTCREGLVLSELPPETPPAPWTFPLRNRIISGLSLGVLLIEARARSGALITSQLAAEQGRELWVLPGPVTSPASIGPLQLIQDGARAVITPGDILRDLGILEEETPPGRAGPGKAGGGPAGRNGPGKPGGAPADRDGEGKGPLARQVLMPGPEEAALLEKIGYGPVHVDRLLSLSGLLPGQLYLGLTNLVRLSLIERLPGDYYQRI